MYTYDFGDSWEHGIAVEKRLPSEPGRAYPVCLAGERHGPPEDCGGISGFYNLLEAIGDPDLSNSPTQIVIDQHIDVAMILPYPLRQKLDLIRSR